MRPAGGRFTNRPYGKQVTQDSLFNLDVTFPSQGFCQAATSESGSCVTKLPRAGEEADDEDGNVAACGGGWLRGERFV